MSTRAQAIQWIVQNQLSRRNLPSYTRTVLALKAEEAIAAENEKKKHLATGGDRKSEEYKQLHQEKTNQHSQKSDCLELAGNEDETSKKATIQNTRPFVNQSGKTEKQIKTATQNDSRTATKVGKIAGVSRDTVAKVKEIEAKATPEVKIFQTVIAIEK